LNASDGTKKWEQDVPQTSSDSPTVANGIVYVPGGNDRLFALDASDGSKLWDVPTTECFGGETATPAVAGSTVYINEDCGKLWAINGSDGSVKWKFDDGSGRGTGSPPTVKDGTVYFGTVKAGSTQGNTVFAVDAATGNKQWEFNSTPEGDIRSSPAVANGKVFFGSNNENVYALDASDGTRLWNFSTGDSVESSPAVADGVVYVGSDDGNLYGIDAETGEKSFSFDTGGSVGSSPAVVNGVAYVGEQPLLGNGNMYALESSDCSNVSYNGDGTEANPYEVGNVDQLQCIEEQGLSANYVQVSDIDASGTSAWNNGKGFEPIGEFDFPREPEFTGTFDGSGHTVSGLKIDRGNTRGVGLFAAVGSGGHIKNAGVEKVDITGGDDVGGLVGRNEGTVERSYATGNVFGGGGDQGGLIGVNFGTVKNSYATGDVSGGRVGGLVGLNEGTVKKAYAKGGVTGRSRFLGGLVGQNIEGNVTESYWDVQSSGQDSDGGTGLATPEMTGTAATTNMQGFDFTSTWETVTNPDDYPILRWQDETGDNPAPVCSAVTYNGDGTEANPYEVGNVAQLQCINEQGLSANYTQVSDIDASGTPAWTSGNGFEPIAKDTNLSSGFQSTKFTGAFDGADHTISGLTIDSRGLDFAGLFGYVDSGRVENVALKNVDITGDDFVGGLVGRNEGTVRDSYATGNVSGTGVSVGGLVGDNGVTAGGTISESYATGGVSGGRSVGGLVGFNGGDSPGAASAGAAGLNSGGTIRESYATGGVSGGGGDQGGLIGVNFGTVKNSYATGDVSGGRVGGLVGLNEGNLTKSYATGDVSTFTVGLAGGLVGDNDFGGNVTHSYATGDVSGSSRVGGLVGSNGGNVTESYWDTETTGQSTSAGNGTGLTTSEMTGSAATNNMQGFNFTSTWETVTNPDDYPILVWQTDEAAPLFRMPIIDRFEGPPTNTGELDPTLYEDLDGDGDGTDVTQTVAVFGELIRGNDLGLTNDQARALNWNQGSPETEVTPSDMVSLFGEQIRS